MIEDKRVKFKIEIDNTACQFYFTGYCRLGKGDSVSCIVGGEEKDKCLPQNCPVVSTNTLPESIQQALNSGDGVYRP